MPINERVIFDAAVEIADPKARQTFVEKACEGNVELQARIAALLKSHEDAGSFLELPAVHSDENLPDTRVDQTIVNPPLSDVPSPTEIIKALTPSTDNAADNDAGQDDEEEHRVDLSFLQPSAKAGSIGTLGHYEILKVLGQGGFGVVFKAFDEKLHRHVAIKVMNPQMAATSPPRKRFLREARSAAAIRHENIVAVHSVEEQPLPYLVMEFIDGQTLQQKLDVNGPFDVPEVLYLGQQIASGLAAAHALGLIHRDIKPGNILIEGDVEQKVKITDFGLARAADDASLTRSGMISGTPMYMAPEQAMGQTLDHRTDLFSLGSVLYQMACGRPPFRAPSTVAVLRRVAEDTPRALQEIVPELPDWLVVIINKLLAKKPDDRFQSAKEVAELLGKCRTELQLNGQVTCIPASNPASGAASAPRVPTTPANSTGEPVYRTPAEAIFAARAEAYSKLSPAELQKVRSRKRWTVLLLTVLFIAAIMSPYLKEQLGKQFNAWLLPPIPTLPATELTTGLNFDGKFACVEFAPANWSFPQFTIEAFVTSAPHSDNGIIVSLTNGGTPWEIMELYDGHDTGPGQRQSGAQIMGKTPIATAYGPLTPGVRQHRALVFDGSHMHYYINGIWQGKRRAEGHERMMWNLSQLRLGSDGDRKKLFEGRIDQVRISKVARYNGNFAPVTSVTSDESTLALYNFDEGTGDVLKDASGNGHDGMILGAEWVNSKSADLTFNPSSQPSEISNSKSQISNALTHGWPNPSTEDVDRDVALWVLSHPGGSVVIGPEVKAVTSSADLPTTPFHVWDINFSQGVVVKDADFALVGRAAKLKRIFVNLAPVAGDFSGEAVRLLAESACAKSLTTVYIAPTAPVSDSSIGYFNEMENLESLTLIGSNVTDAGVEKLRLRKLNELNLGGPITKNGLISLATHSPNLSLLCLGGADITGPGIEVLRRFPLKSITLGTQTVTNTDIHVISQIPTIEGLYLSHSTGFDGKGLAQLSDAPQFYSLHLFWTRTNDATLAGVAEIARLQDLQLGCTKVTDAGVLHLARLPKLRLLGLNDTAITDLGLATLQSFSTLEQLNLRGCKNITALGVRKLKAILPKCEIFTEFSGAESGWHGWPSDAPAPAIAPFNAEQAKQHQEAWAKYLKVPVEYTNSIGMKFVLIPPGEFAMGGTTERH